MGSISHHVGSARRSSRVLVQTGIGLALAIAFVVAGLTGIGRQAPADAAPAGFVTRVGAKLFLDGVAFRWVGANSFHLAGCGFSYSDAEIDAVLGALPRGTVMRTFAYQPLLGTAAGLDRIVAHARAKGIRLLLSLTDGNRKGVGDNSCGAGGHDSNWYRGGWRTDLGPWIDALTSHFRDDPTIFGYEVISEGWNDTPDGCPSDARAVAAAFYDGAARRIKASDPNHLVSSGSLGPYACGHGDYASIHASPAMDLVSFHSYIYDWDGGVSGGTSRITGPNGWWSNEVMTAAHTLGKPAYIGEDGILAGTQCTTTSISRRVTDIAKILDSYMTNGEAVGVNLWQVTAQGDYRGCQYDARYDDPQWAVVRSYSIAGKGNPTAGAAVAPTTTVAPAPTTTVAPATTAPAPTTTTAPAPTPAGFVPMAAKRIVDTRLGLGIPSRLAAAVPARVTVAGVAGVAKNATAVQLNVTAIGGAAGGYLTVYPCGQVPVASNVNFAAGQIVPNSALVGVVDRSICFYSNVAVDVVVDVTGYVQPGVKGRFAAVTPARLLDTREGTSTPIAAGSTATLSISAPSGALAANLNVASAGADGPGYLTVYPCGSSRPGTSTLNPAGGAEPARANGATVAIDSTGSVCVYSTVATDLVVDLLGWWRSEGVGHFVPTTPERLFDSRSDGGQGGRRSAGSVLRIDLSAVMASGGSAQLNIAAVDPSAAGFVTAWPCREPMPTSSVLNHGTGGATANAFVALADTGGQLCLYTKAATDLVVDLQGVLA